MDKTEVLKKCDVFRQLNEEQLKVIEKMCTAKVFEPGEFLCQQGRLGHNLFVIEEGLVGIMLETGPLSLRQVQAATRFDAVDWSATIEPYICTATVKAIEQTSTLAINGRELDNLSNTRPDIDAKVFRGIARVVVTRLRHAYTQLLGLHLPDTSSKGYV